MFVDLLADIKKTIYAVYNETSRAKKNVLRLTEDHPDASCKEVKFRFSGKLEVYKFDKKVKNAKDAEQEEPLPILDEIPPARSKCDFLIFYVHKNRKNEEKLYAIVCNLKSGSKGNMEDQMLSGGILAEFLLQTAIRCHNFWNSNTPNFEDLDYQALCRDKKIIFREIAVYSKMPIEKGGTKPSSAKSSRVNKPCNAEHDLDTSIH